MGSQVIDAGLYDATTYWEHRYSTGEHSGAGSRGDHATAKAAAINAFIDEHQITSVVDWGCGDGYLTELFDLSGVDYCGIDISRTAVGIGLLRYGTHQFVKWNPLSRVDIKVTAELALSVDVLFHLADDIYPRYMDKVFQATRFVVVYAPSMQNDPDNAPHVKYRRWLADVPSVWLPMSEPADGDGPWCFGRAT